MPLNAIGNIPEQRNTQMVTSSMDAHGLAYSTFISADDNRVFTVIGNSLDHQGHDLSTLFSPDNADPNADLTLTDRDGQNVWKIGDHNMIGDVNSTTVHGMILNGSVITAMNDGNEIEMSAAAQVSRAPDERWNSTLLGFGHKKAFEYKNLKAPRERIQFNPPVPAPPSQSMMASQISASAVPLRNAVQTSQWAYQQKQNISSAPTVPMTSEPATSIARQPEEFRTPPLHPGFMAPSSVIRMMQPQPTTYIPTPIYPQSSVVPPAASYLSQSSVLPPAASYMSQSSVVPPAATYMSQSSSYVPQGTSYMSQSSPFVQPGTSYMSHPAPFVTPAENWMSTPSAMQMSSRATHVPQQWIPHMPPPWAMRMALPTGAHMPSLLAAHRASPQTTQTQDPDTSAPH
ncbi:tyrosine-protein kinase sid-3 [Biomphalaria pfeifferi]|uniref:Tyrosine-protein kinase sid-3 n=1 Tax=Biomphalaria pfeifferi TaxID=112525 RepID=A0AAD8FGL2_BIOPF|nr:tyrosine-protein kinase sid-3 [Biomphalaria pfeifferi]